MSSHSSASGNPPWSSFPNRLDSFKQTIHFDEALLTDNKNEYIDLTWDNISPPPQLNDWTVIDHELRLEKMDGSRNFSWQFKKDESLFTIFVRIFKPGSSDASNCFLQIANATTTMDIPYNQGPKNLGTLSAVSKYKGSGIFWFYRNICIEITPSGTEIDHLEIAYWLQSIMLQHKKKING